MNCFIKRQSETTIIGYDITNITFGVYLNYKF